MTRLPNVLSAILIVGILAAGIEVKDNTLTAGSGNALPIAQPMISAFPNMATE